VARLVEKRTLVFLTLAVLVWAVSISGLAGYFYLQNATYTQQIGENQQSLNKAASNYDESMSKYNTLLTEYSILYYSYSSPDANFTLLMEPFGRLMENLRSNYSCLLMNQEDLNETYYTLEENYQLIYQEGNVTREDFEGLLNEYYDLFNLLAMRELSIVVSETVTLTVSICINYGNETEEWHNETNVPAGCSLFQLTQSVATIDLNYNPLMKPGHVFLKAINDKAEYTNYNPEEGYSEGCSWLWYHWNDDKQNWILGPVGCDAWILENGGIYKWSFDYWRWPP
jgi:hypothetical protein